MRRNLKSLWAIGVLLTALAVNIEMAADGCSKWCGAAGNGDFGSRYSEDCGPEGCGWVECVTKRWGCQDAFNDACGSPDWCPPLE